MQPARGIYFRREDYASFPIRVFVDVVDLIVFAVFCVAVAAVLAVGLPGGKSTFNLMFLTWLAAALFYFVVLKRSAFGTLGYRWGKVRVVGLDGRVPGYWSLILRLLFGMLGPLNWVLDLIWLTSDANRQSLRDKFANTYVIKANAQFAGEGPLVFRYYSICGCTWLFREVEFAPVSATRD
jgi:uncharacterized RDD family membrane protein YckC